MESNTESVDVKYEIGEEIGKGKFATVKRCRDRQTASEYAAKFIRKNRGVGRRGAKMENIEKEIQILKETNHRNIINLYEVYETKREVILILELVDGGELFEYLSEKDKLSEEEASSFVRQILDGVEHLHSRNIAHLDLKPENILLQDKNSTSVKLIDFGLSRKILPKEDHRAIMGTAEFCAPEVISFEQLSVSTDMWSIGVITYVLLSGLSPFLGDNQQETYHNITSINFEFDEDYFNGTSDLAKDFIKKLLVKDTRKRASVNDCLNHPWIQPVEKRDKVLRRSSVINTEHLKRFIARQRWKRSMKLVSLCNRLSRSMQLRRVHSSDTLGSTSEEDLEDLNDSDKQKTVKEPPAVQVMRSSGSQNSEDSAESVRGIAEENDGRVIDSDPGKAAEESPVDVNEETNEYNLGDFEANITLENPVEAGTLNLHEVKNLDKLKEYLTTNETHIIASSESKLEIDVSSQSKREDESAKEMPEKMAVESSFVNTAIDLKATADTDSIVTVLLETAKASDLEDEQRNVLETADAMTDGLMSKNVEGLQFGTNDVLVSRNEDKETVETLNELTEDINEEHHYTATETRVVESPEVQDAEQDETIPEINVDTKQSTLADLPHGLEKSLTTESQHPEVLLQHAETTVIKQTLNYETKSKKEHANLDCSTSVGEFDDDIGQLIEKADDYGFPSDEFKRIKSPELTEDNDIDSIVQKLVRGVIAHSLELVRKENTVSETVVEQMSEFKGLAVKSSGYTLNREQEARRNKAVKQYDPLHVACFEADESLIENRGSENLLSEDKNDEDDFFKPSTTSKFILPAKRRALTVKRVKPERKMMKKATFWEVEDCHDYKRCEMFEMQVFNNSE